MKFCWTTIKVKDMEESLRFYQDIVGLSVFRRFSAGEEKEITFLGDGETKVELVYEGNKEINIGQDISMGFEVDSVERMMEYLKEKGYPVHIGLIQPNPKTKFFFVLDPNGVMIQFVENC